MKSHRIVQATDGPGELLWRPWSRMGRGLRSDSRVVVGSYCTCARMTSHRLPGVDRQMVVVAGQGFKLTIVEDQTIHSVKCAPGEVLRFRGDAKTESILVDPDAGVTMDLGVMTRRCGGRAANLSYHRADEGSSSLPPADLIFAATPGVVLEQDCGHRVAIDEHASLFVREAERESWTLWSGSCAVVSWDDRAPDESSPGV